MDGTAESQTLLESIEELLDQEKDLWSPDLKWVGGKVLPDDSVIFLHREWKAGPILGRRVVLAEFRKLFDPELSIRDLAQIIVSDEICDPTGHGTPLDIDWADGLIPSREIVEWIGVSPEDARKVFVP